MSAEQYPLAFCEANRVLRLEDREGRPVAAFAGTADPEVVRRLAFFHGAPPLCIALSQEEFSVRLGRLHSFSASEGEAPAADGEDTDIALGDIDGEGPVVNYVDSLLMDAIARGASDVHIEWGRPAARVRFRVDGRLMEAGGFPSGRFPAVSSRLKLMANLDIVERRLPQDGRISVEAAGGRVDIRAPFVPASRGESIVLRILPGSGALRAAEELGLPRAALDALLAMADRPQGLILATGPTGSGKTTTLCALAQRLVSRGLKVITIEDPVEYALPGAVQVQVNEAAGLGFSGLLGRVLRQDPDAIVVGEIRDAETAALALRAALTGHLVLSSLHTNDAAGAVERLRDLGCPPYLIAATLRGVLAQRLLRRRCPRCARGRTAEAGEPCPLCRGSLWAGRVAAFELLECAQDCAALISAGADGAALRSWMRSRSHPSLAEEGRRLAAEGLSTLEEAAREVEL